MNTGGPVGNGINGTDQRPVFVTAGECTAWLTQTPLANPVQAQALMLRQLNLLNRHPLDAGERLAILETLRKPLLLVQDESARRFIGRPLPLVPPEQAAFDTTQALWQSLLGGYLRCIETLEDPQHTLALLVQRAMTALAAAEFDTYRAGFQQGSEHWQTLHGLYAVAEAAGVAEAPVEDQARQGKTLSSVAAVYSEMLLLHAVSPHELPLRHLLWVARWARRWSVKIVISAKPPGAGRAVPLCVDLAQSEPAGYRPGVASTVRWLDTEGARQSLKKRLLLLDEGKSPADLQLGDDCMQPACSQVLRHTYQRWCKGGFTRRSERQAADSRCEAIFGVEAIHYYLAGRTPFRQPSFADDATLRREREQIATFGRVAQPSSGAYERQQGYQIEQWRVVDESPAGIHATRGAGGTSGAGGRITRGQLVALRLDDAQHFLIGSLRWGTVTAQGDLHAGMLLVPGRPETVALRGTDAASLNEAYRPGFVLPAVPALGSVASVVLPPGQFRHGRLLDVAGGQYKRLRILQLLDRGTDFDRASFEPAD